MKRERSPDHFLVKKPTRPGQRHAGFVEVSTVALGLVSSVPDEKLPKPPPPLPSLFDLLKKKFGLQIEISAPEWARRAADMTFDALTPKRRKRQASESYNVGFDSGYMHGVEELLASMPPHEQVVQIVDGIHGCHAILKASWAEQPSDKAADFFCGFRDGEKLMRGAPGRAQQMAQRTKIYRTIAARWKEVALGVLNDTGELHQWLLSQKVISPGTDSSEIRLVCAKIGLRYKKPGKPRKQKM